LSLFCWTKCCTNYFAEKIRVDQKHEINIFEWISQAAFIVRSIFKFVLQS
jgi:hypothetical protein